MAGFTESHVEQAALDWFGGLGYEVRLGPGICPSHVILLKLMSVAIRLRDTKKAMKAVA